MACTTRDPQPGRKKAQVWREFPANLASQSCGRHFIPSPPAAPVVGGELYQGAMARLRARLLRRLNYLLHPVSTVHEEQARQACGVGQ